MMTKEEYTAQLAEINRIDDRCKTHEEAIQLFRRAVKAEDHIVPLTRIPDKLLQQKAANLLKLAGVVRDARFPKSSGDPDILILTGRIPLEHSLEYQLKELETLLRQTEGSLSLLGVY